jgi:hypothetical protein
MDSARALSANLVSLLRREHDALAEFLVALAVFDERRLWAELGYASLFYYLHRELRLSKGAAQYRKVAAELIQKIPAVVEPLREGRLCLTSITEAAKVVTPENWEAVLPRFYGLSKREAMEVVAALQPHPAPPTRAVFTAPSPAAARDASPTLLLDVGTAPALAAAEGESRPSPGWPDELPPLRSPAPAPPRPAELVPLTAEQVRLHVTVTNQFAKKLEQAKAARPGESVEALLEAGLDLLLSQAAKRKGLVEKPQKKLRPSKAEHIPAHVRREVWKRDGGRCQWKLHDGELCGCTVGLQFDHVEPLALGGTSTADNVRLLCPAHNREAARLVLGDWVLRYARKGREVRAPAASVDPASRSRIVGVAPRPP